MNSLSEAFIRVEQAKLYQVLLSNDIFDSSAADAEILEIVTEEIRAFALARLETLMGLRQGADALIVRNGQDLPWSEDQIEALTVLANKVLNSNTGTKTVMKPKTPIQPTMKQKNSTKREIFEESVESNNYSLQNEVEFKKGNGFVNNPERQPFPSQSVIDMIHANEANKNAASMGGTTGGNTGTYLIQQLLK